MFNFLKAMRHLQRAPSAGESAAPVQDKSRQSSGLHRELVRGIFNDVMRSHAVPTDSVTFVAFSRQPASGRSELHIQLIVLEWNEALWRQAPLLLQQMQAGMAQCRKFLDLSECVVAWRLSPVCREVAASTRAVAPTAAASTSALAGEYSLFDRRRNCDRRRQNAAAANALRDSTQHEPLHQENGFKATEISRLI